MAPPEVITRDFLHRSGFIAAPISSGEQPATLITNRRMGGRAAYIVSRAEWENLVRSTGEQPATQGCHSSTELRSMLRTYLRDAAERGTHTLLDIRGWSVVLTPVDWYETHADPESSVTAPRDNFRVPDDADTLPVTELMTEFGDILHEVDKSNRVRLVTRQRWSGQYPAWVMSRRRWETHAETNPVDPDMVLNYRTMSEPNRDLYGKVFDPIAQGYHVQVDVTSYKSRWHYSVVFVPTRWWQRS